MFHMMVLKGRFLYVIRTCISMKMEILRCREFLDQLTKNTGLKDRQGLSVCHVCPGCGTNLRIPFSKQDVCYKLFSSVPYYLLHFACPFTLSVLTMWRSLCSANISSDTTVTPYVMLGQMG